MSRAGKLLAAAVIILGFASQSNAQEPLKPAAPDKENKSPEDNLAKKFQFSIEGKKLTIEQAIQLVLERNQDLLDTRLDATTSDSAFRKFQSRYDVQLGANGGYQFQDYPDALYSKYGKDATTYDSTISASKVFSTGTTVSAGVTEQYVNTSVTPIPPGNNRWAGGYPDSYNPSMFVKIQQEILKNSFGYSERAQEKILNSSAKIQKNSVSARISSLVAGALTDIWTVSLKKVARDNAEVSLRETKRVRDVIAANARLGISETYDLNFWNAQYAVAEAKSASADQAYRDSVRKLFRTLNYEVTGDLPDMGDISVLSDTYSDVDIEASLKTAYAKRADYLNAKITLDSAKTQLDIYKNDALPSLTLSGSYSSLSVEQTMGKAHSKAASLDTPVYGARFTLTYPLGDSTQATNERDSKINVRQTELRLEKSRIEVKDDVVSKAEAIKVGYLSYQKARTARQESERYYQSILANLRMGKISVAVVKTALDAYYDSRQREVEALVQYNIFLMQFDLSTNLLLEKYNVDLNKYLAEAK
jgi:outer membrane protein TolC